MHKPNAVEVEYPNAELVAEARAFARRQQFEWDNWGDVAARERASLFRDLADALDCSETANP